MVPRDQLAIQSIFIYPLSGNIRLTWNSRVNQSYSVLHSSNLVEWTEAIPSVTAGSEATFAVLRRTEFPEPANFFQIRENN